MSDFKWRRNRDSNPSAVLPAYELSKPAPSTTWVFLQKGSHLKTASEIIAFLFSYFNRSCYNLPGMKEFVIDSKNAGQRIEKFVRRCLPDAPLGFLYKSFRKKDIKVNGHWVTKDKLLQAGDIVRIYVTDQQLQDFSHPKEVERKPFSYPIVYEDSQILLVNKPSGLLVMGDHREKRVTLENDVLAYLYQKGEFDPRNHVFVPSPAHRLDRNTAGIVAFGKTDAALKELTLLFKERINVDKRYLALVKGIPPEEGTINAPLKKDANRGLVVVAPDGKEAVTKYRRLETFGSVSLVECELLTGRTHQIRVHLASINHPIVGDGKYGDFETNRFFRAHYGIEHQFLIAYRLSFKTVGEPLSYLSNRSFAISLTPKQEELLSQLRVARLP